jgi:hypothetical protein
MKRRVLILMAVVVPGVWLGVVAASLEEARGQGVTPALVTTGQVVVEGREVPYRIRHLPVGSFPELPEVVAANLTKTGCLIPQTYEAHRPENVIHGSFERPGSDDWAVLCSVNGQVELLVFFSSNSGADPFVLAAGTEVGYVQSHDVTGVLGFDRGIDTATPQRVHEAQAAMTHRPAAPDHDAIADSIVDQKTFYFLHRADGTWEKLKLE